MKGDFLKMKIFKKTAFLLASLMMILEVSVGFQAVEVSAKVQPLETAYKAYVSHYLYDSIGKKNAKVTYYDLDKDGKDEMFIKYTVNGKNAYKVYTYRAKNKKEVVQIMNITSNGVSMTRNGKTLRVVTTKGSTLVTVDYVKSGNKLLQKNTYESRTNGFYKNGKAISAADYNKDVVSKTDDYVNVFAGAKKIRK